MVSNSFHLEEIRLRLEQQRQEEDYHRSKLAEEQRLFEVNIELFLLIFESEDG